MAMLDAAHDKAEDFLNSEGRSLRHVALGATLCIAAAALSAVIAWKRAPTESNPHLEREFDDLDKSAMEPPKSAYSMLWPALFSVMTLSALRIWNAPSGPERTRALALWGGLQGLNALWMWVSPKRRVLQLGAAISTFLTTAFYARAAEKVDRKSATLVAPYAGWVSFASLLNTELWAKNRPKGSTLH
jgi:tryptophan-rich sensory protein